jgi:hypothetical protein
MTGVEVHDTGGKLSRVLLEVTESLHADTVTLRELLGRVGEQGMLLGCGLLSLPFLIPVSIPGVSTVFGLAIILLGIGVTLNRVPWLPAKILDRPLPTPPLKKAFLAQARMVERAERLIKPRFTPLTATAAFNLVHGMALLLAGVLLMAPLGLVPFSNTLPALAVLFLSLGLVERDGVFIIGGYVMNVATIAYFSVLALGAYKAGQGLFGFL